MIKDQDFASCVLRVEKQCQFFSFLFSLRSILTTHSQIIARIVLFVIYCNVLFQIERVLLNYTAFQQYLCFFTFRFSRFVKVLFFFETQIKAILSDGTALIPVQ